MDDALQWLARHGYVALFLAVLGEQAGLPVPAIPILLGVGAMAGLGLLSLPAVVLVAVAAAVTGDLGWYWLARRHGRAMLHLICRISLEPASCPRRATDALARHGPRLLLFSKFVPGLSLAAPPLVALFHMPFGRFLAWDTAGAVLWVVPFVGVGHLFHEQVHALARQAAMWGGLAAIAAGGGLVAYVLAKALGRRRFLRRLRTARVTADEARRLLSPVGRVLVADLRHALEVAADPFRIPGALCIQPEDLARLDEELPRDRDIVLYCTCPDEATSALVARQLHRRGIVRVRPLAGGLDGWRAAGFPVEPMGAACRTAPAAT